MLTFKKNLNSYFVAFLDFLISFLTALHNTTVIKAELTDVVVVVNHLVLEQAVSLLTPPQV